MTKHPRRLLALLGIAALSVCFLGQAVAGADDYPPTLPSIPTGTPPGGTPNNTPSNPTGTLNTSGTVVAGGGVGVSGTGCGPNQTVTIGFNGSAVASTTTDPIGRFSTTFVVPASTPPGQYAVTASNLYCSLVGTVQVEAAAAARAATRALAFTGSSSTIPILWVGVGLVGLGALLVFVARRRLSGARTF